MAIVHFTRIWFQAGALSLDVVEDVEDVVRKIHEARKDGEDGVWFQHIDSKQPAFVSLRTLDTFEAATDLAVDTITRQLAHLPDKIVSEPTAAYAH